MFAGWSGAGSGIAQDQLPGAGLPVAWWEPRHDTASRLGHTVVATTATRRVIRSAYLRVRRVKTQSGHPRAFCSAACLVSEGVGLAGNLMRLVIE